MKTHTDAGCAILKAGGSMASRLAAFMAGLQFPTAGAWDDCADCAVMSLRPAPCQCCGKRDRLLPLHALDPATGPVHRNVCADCHDHIINR